MKFSPLIIVLLAAFAFGQSGRAPQQNPSQPADERSVKAMFDEVNGYNKAKFAEYEAKKLPYSERLRLQTEREQKQLAARYAAIAAARANSSGDDLYYTGLLNWIAENLDNTNEALKKFLASPEPPADRAQTARSIVAVIAAKQRRLDDAMASLAEYSKNTPVKLSDRVRMEGEISKAFFAAGKWPEAAEHAEAAYKAAKTVLLESGMTQRGLDETLDAGMLLFDSHRAAGNAKEADAALADLRKTGAAVASPSLFAYAADKLITYMIETGRKPLAMETYLESLAQAGRDLPNKPTQDDAARRIKKRERQYKLLGEPAPELADVDKWIPGSPKTIQSLRGRVVILDFWATWCGPCFDAFPALSEWHRDLAAEGLTILGVTRYYGSGEGLPLDEAGEIEFLKRFKAKQGLPYDFAVAKGQTSQFLYAATGLPTVVLIDRKGVVRYIESGTNPTRVEELRQMTLRLMAEK